MRSRDLRLKCLMMALGYATDKKENNVDLDVVLFHINSIHRFSQLKAIVKPANKLQALFHSFFNFFHSYFCCFILPRQKRPSNFLTLNKVLFFNTFLDVVKHPFHLKRSTLSSDRFSKIYCMLRTLLLYSAFLLLAFLKSIHKQDLLYMKTDAY